MFAPIAFLAGLFGFGFVGTSSVVEKVKTNYEYEKQKAVEANKHYNDSLQYRMYRDMRQTGLTYGGLSIRSFEGKWGLPQTPNNERVYFLAVYVQMKQCGYDFNFRLNEMPASYDMEDQIVNAAQQYEYWYTNE